MGGREEEKENIFSLERAPSSPDFGMSGEKKEEKRR
jgi:hypothetical protein